MPARKKEIKDQRSKIGTHKQKKQLQGFLSRGLSETEARHRLRQMGANTIKERKEEGLLSIFVSQFKSPLIYILVIAALITFALGDYIDTGVIGLAVVVNTILGFYQERKAQKALAALRKLLSPKATVIRDGKRVEVDAASVVPGDVCILGLGERVPADGLVLEAKDFSVTEAILTGESAPVHKGLLTHKANVSDLDQLRAQFRDAERKNKVFAGTIISSGEASIVAGVTGEETEVGKIALSLEETSEEPTPLQKRIARFSKQIAVLVGVVSTVIFVTGILLGSGEASLTERFRVMFTTSVAIAVAAVPEGLAVSLTVILALGMQRILHRKALVRKLVAAETLGSVTVICADKTGTLTEGVMRVTETEFSDEKEGVRAAILTNDRRDPLEVAVWNWVQEQGQDPQRLVDDFPRLDSIPFSPEEKFTAKLYAESVYVMGAPEIVLSFCKLTGSTKLKWMRKFEAYGMRGLRIVGFAMRQAKKGERKLTKKSIKSGLTWLGIVAYEDPVRSGVASALAQAKQAGIDVKVITGDYRATAEAVLVHLGLLTRAAELKAKLPLVMEGEELKRLSPDELRGRVAQTILFARIDPVQKLKIVEALQANGEVVAMTGDGVNDAPAIKKANIGIVVSGATDVSKETADMVLLDDNFATIVAAVEEGRGIFENLRKVILYLFSDAFAEVIIILTSLAFRLPLPLTAAQILWVNLVDDGLPNLAITVDPKDKDLLKRKPRARDEPLMDAEIKVLVGLVSLTAAIVVLVIFSWYQRSTDLSYARTMAFTTLAVSTLVYSFSSRSLRRPIWKEGILVNKWLVGAVFGGFLIQLSALHVPLFQDAFATQPLRLFDWGVVLSGGLAVVAVIETVKWVFVKKRRLQQEWDKVLY